MPILKLVRESHRLKLAIWDLAIGDNLFMEEEFDRLTKDEMY